MTPRLSDYLTMMFWSALVVGSCEMGWIVEALRGLGQ